MSYELMSNPNYANNDADDTRWNVISSTEDITQHIDLLLSEAEQEAYDIGINDIFDDADDRFDNGSDIFDKMTELDTEAVNEAANNIDDTVFDDDICSLATGHAGIIVNPDVYSTSSAKQSHTSYTNDDYEQANNGMSNSNLGCNADIPSAYTMSDMLIKDNDFMIAGKALYCFIEHCHLPVDDDTLDMLILDKHRAVIERIGIPTIIKSVRTFIKKEPRLVVDKPIIDPNYIPCRNGRINLYKHTFEPNGPDIFHTSFINVDYDPNCTDCENFDRLVDYITYGDELEKERLLQSLGNIIMPDMNAKKFYILQGPGDTGKSLFIEFITRFFTDDFVSSVDLQELGDNFISGILAGKRLNVGGDLPNQELKPNVIKVVKKATGNDLTLGNLKYAPHFKYRPSAKLVFATNHSISMQYDDEAFRERLVILPFTRKVPKEEQDHDLIDKLCKEMPAIFNKLLAAYLRYRDNHYILPETGAEPCVSVNATHKTNNTPTFLDKSIEDFVAERCLVTGEKTDFISSNILHSEFSTYYKEKYNLCVSIDRFSKVFKKMYDSEDGPIQRANKDKLGRGYVGITLINDSPSP